MLDEIVSILNNKGYHLELYHGVESTKYFTIKELLEFIVKNEKSKERLEIVGISSINLDFEKDYDFQEIPKGFHYMKGIRKLSKLIYLYEEDVFELKSVEEIEKEEKNNLQLLKEWADSLPERKDDKNE